MHLGGKVTWDLDTIRATATVSHTMKHPALRVAAWQWIVPEYQRLLTDTIMSVAVPALPFHPVRVELVGSLARGCAHADSDIDLNLAAHDWNEQVEWRRLWRQSALHLKFLDAMRPITSSLHVKVDVAPNNPDQYKYDLTYDLATGAYTNPKKVFPDSTARWWDGHELRWRTRPLWGRTLAFGNDEWAHEVEPWRRRYGDRYLSNDSRPWLTAE